MFKSKILALLARRDYKPLRLSRLAKVLDISSVDYPAFKSAFTQLRKSEKVTLAPGNLITLPKISEHLSGTFKANPNGFGFVIPLQPNSHGDLYIAREDTAGAMTGDTVAVHVLKKGKRGGQIRYAGRILEIIQRSRNQFVGTLLQQHKEWIVQPDGKDFIRPITVDDVGAKGAAEKDKVVVEILSYPTDRFLARGVIIEVLGKAGRYAAETASIIKQFQLPQDFNQPCLDEAAQAAAKFDPDNSSNRDDISSEMVITIDPPDAKDFDDAISLKRDKDNNWVLGVHIADVSHFVPMDSELDTQSRDRGNSVYLPAKTIPMLPEILSNGVCSLQPNQKRFAKSVYITYNDRGNVLARSFANSILCSKARLTYQQAEQILRGKAADFPGDVVALVKDMETLSRIIEHRRKKNGMIQLDLPETELVLDKQGRVVDAHPADDSYPHTVIEMFMVEANEAVASLLDRFNVPFIRRIHPAPDNLATKNLSRFIKICGLKVPRHLDRAAMQDLLASAKGKPYSFAINLVVLRSLAKAEYAPFHIGHFALASKNYCHFTSPIRRYADLTAHRLLQCYLEQRLNMIGLEEALPEHELEQIGKHITLTEQRADNAEKELKKVLILQMLKDKLGEELDCVITGLTNFGIFVQCLRFGIEGRIKLEDLGIDEWKYVERSQAVIGLHSGKSVHLGQPMKVRIVAVNVAARQLDVVPAEPLVKTRDQLKKKQKRNHRKKKSPHRPKAKQR